jgi:hypothetical protein
MVDKIYPSKVFVQVLNDGGMSPETKAVIEELKLRSIYFDTRTTEDIVLFGKPLPLDKSDLVVGDFDWTRIALNQLGIPMPKVPDYPECLKYLLNRNVWKSTLSELKEYFVSGRQIQIFIKPAENIKAFSGLIANNDWIDYLIEEFSPAFSIFCSELVDFVSEYRVYIVNWEIKATCHYKGLKDIQLDLDIVKSAVNLFFQTDEGKNLTGCAIDFGVIKKGDNNDINNCYLTSLIEVNDGFSLGMYEGISAKDYTDLLIARWKTLMCW